MLFGMLTRAALRSFSTQALSVVNNVAKQCFTVSLKEGADNAVIEYKQTGKTITLMHTDVPDIFQGKGVGKLLAKYAFDHAQKEKLNVICQCHFLAKFYENNLNKYKDLNIKIELVD